MIPTLQPAQVSIFQQLNVTAPTTWAGGSPHDWAESLAAGLGSRYALSKSPLSRAALSALWRNSSVSVEACFLSTMAWGGMKRDNGRRIWSARSHWLSVCNDVRAGLHTRATGFNAFSALRAKGLLPGMGPAYFTKVLFFASPHGDAYILDQWTARSMHLLSGQGRYPSVRKDYTSASKAKRLSAPHMLRVIVDDRVTSADYVDYCIQVDSLAVTLGWTAHQVEERLFSNGGKSPHPWRAHVMSGWAGPSWCLYP